MGRSLPTGRALRTNIVQNVTLACASQGLRRRGAASPQRSAESVERPPLSVQYQGISFRRTGSFCTGTGNVSHENREVIARFRQHVSNS